MTDDAANIASDYNHTTEQEPQRLEYHRLEYDMTWRHCEKRSQRKETSLKLRAAMGYTTVELSRRQLPLAGGMQQRD